MSKSRKIPAYVHHKPTGQACVRINGRDFHLGIYGSTESHERYDDLVAEHVIDAEPGSCKTLTAVLAAWYGMTVRREWEERTERAVSPGAVYATLDRVENKGYVKSDKRKAGAECQGRARRIFRVEPSGLTALRKTLECVERMPEGLPELGEATC
ncbi:MAG: PadR family transcriptional regulator [Fuerstiella sp.]